MAGLTQLSTNRSTIREQAARHPMIAFVVLAYAISWIAWLLIWLLGMDVGSGLFIIAAAGPALAAMMISAILRPEPTGIPAENRWRLFGMLAIFVLAVLVIRREWITDGLINVVGRTSGTVAYPTLTSFLVDILAAGVVAFLLSGIHSPRLGVCDLLRSLNTRYQPVRWYWFAVAVGLYPVVILLGNAISAWLGLPVPAPRVTGLWYWLALDALIMFLFVMIGGGGLEEPGWRGFALPLLQKHYSPLRSSLILAVIWAFWHWPLFWFGYYGGGPLGVFSFVLGTAPIAILFTGVFNRTGGSLPIVILLHTSINTIPAYLPVSSIAAGLWIFVAISLGVFISSVGKIKGDMK